VTEKKFLQMVRELAWLHGYRSYHTHDSRRSESGFPDLVLVRPARRGVAGRTIFAELKIGKNCATAEQEAWLEALRSTGQAAYLWRPEDWETIEEILGGPA
jgi:VRR-NUC domain